MLKILFTAAMLTLIYFIFFKKPKVKAQKGELEDMVECTQCGVFISADEAIEKKGEYFCSKECLK